MFYDARFGEAITLTGQYIIKTVSSHCDLRFNEFFKTTGVQYSTYMDTDSIFFTFGHIVAKYWSNQPDLKIVDALDKMVETKLRPFIDEATDTIATVQNHYVKTIFFKRENIAKGGFWCLHPESQIFTLSGDVSIKEIFDSSSDTGDVRSIDRSLLNYNMEDSVKVDSAVLALRKWYEGDMFSIESPDGRILQVTANHEILVVRNKSTEWVMAKDLNEHDLLVSINNFETTKGDPCKLLNHLNH